jgi:hypothetical protein
MVRVFESACGLVMLFIVLPVLVPVWIGLRLSGARPLFVVRQDPRTAATVPLLEFNTRSSPFGNHLRRYGAEKVAALLWLVAGKCRLADIIASMRYS